MVGIHRNIYTRDHPYEKKKLQGKKCSKPNGKTAETLQKNCPNTAVISTAGLLKFILQLCYNFSCSFSS